MKNKNIGRIFAWFIVVSCSIVNIVLLWNFSKLYFIPDIEVAKAQFILTILVFYVGLPVVFMSAIFVVASIFIKERNKGLSGALRYNYGVGIVAFVNGFIPLVILCILYWYMEKWTL